MSSQLCACTTRFLYAGRQLTEQDVGQEVVKVAGEDWSYLSYMEMGQSNPTIETFKVISVSKTAFQLESYDPFKRVVYKQPMSFERDSTWATVQELYAKISLNAHVRSVKYTLECPLHDMRINDDLFLDGF